MARPSSNRQLAQRATITDMAAFQRLDILWGTTTEGLLLMSDLDWRRAVEVSCIVLDEGIPDLLALSRIEVSGSPTSLRLSRVALDKAIDQLISTSSPTTPSP